MIDLDPKAVREAMRTLNRKTPYRTLVPDPALSGGKESGNLIVQGDNLAVMRSLLPVYAGKVKCIFTDPPYNTKKSFKNYNDSMSNKQWQEFMYVRLAAMREMLSDDGSLWIAIDDRECHYLKVLADHVFGRENFVSDIAWEHRASGAGMGTICRSYNSILVYRKTESFVMNRLTETPNPKEFSNPDNDPLGPWKQITTASSKPHSDNCRYSVTDSYGRKIPPPKFGWVLTKDNFRAQLAEGRIFVTPTGAVVRKVYLDTAQGRIPKSLWYHSEAGTSSHAAAEMRGLFGAAHEKEGQHFATPKPEKLVHRVLTLGSNKGDLVFDAFLGCGTTAAVAHKMGRRYLGAELGEQAVEYCAPRLQKVVTGERGGVSETTGWRGGGGFTFARLGEPLFSPTGEIDPDATHANLSTYLWFNLTGIPRSFSGIKPFLGIHAETAYYLVGTLTEQSAAKLLPHDGKRVVYYMKTEINAKDLKKYKLTAMPYPQPTPQPTPQ